MNEVINEFTEKIRDLLDWAKGNGKIDQLIVDEEIMPEVEFIAKKLIEKYSK